MSTTSFPHEIVRVRHETRRRTLTVSGVELVTPRMRRVHFTSPDLADFHSSSPDDHVKLFFPRPDDPSGKPAMRDYTPRAFSAADRTLTVDFALHDAGPATAWAVAAEVGRTLEIGGPRGSHLAPDDFDWVLLVGDESALPAIGRRVEELRDGVPVTTIALVADEAEAQTFAPRAAWTPTWVTRGESSDRDAELVLQALAGFSPPAGDGFVWIAGEASMARAARTYVLDVLNHQKAWIRATGYWKRGAADEHVELGE